MYLLLTLIGITARNIRGNTIYLVLLIFEKARAYNTSIFRFNKTKQKELKTIVILILNEISIVEAKLLNFVLLVFR